MAKRKFRRAMLAAVALSAAAFTAFTIWQNVTVGTTRYKIDSKKVPAAFNGFKTAQISDLHMAEFGEDNSRIIEILEHEKPDIIAITGDLIDRIDRPDKINMVMRSIKRAVKIAPCYYVPGNHEAVLGDVYKMFEKRLTVAGVNVLRDEAVDIERGGSSVRLIGIDDPDFSYVDSSESGAMVLEKVNMLARKGAYNIVLCHRPEIFDAYVESEADLVLTGHAHGGQIRVPIVGALVAPDQGWLPEYDAGRFERGKTVMIVSRGLGTSIIPVRILDRPEAVIIEL